jgi:hypothetical protein
VNLPPGSSLDNPWATFPGGNPFPYSFDPSNPHTRTTPGTYRCLRISNQRPPTRGTWPSSAS